MVSKGLYEQNKLSNVLVKIKVVFFFFATVLSFNEKNLTLNDKDQKSKKNQTLFIFFFSMWNIPLLFYILLKKK